MKLLSFDEWKTSFCLETYSFVSIEDFPSKVKIETSRGKMYSVNQWNSTFPEKALARQELKFWHDLLHAKRDEYLESFFSYRIELKPSKVVQLNHIFQGHIDVAPRPPDKLTSSFPLSRLVRQLHWADLGDTPVSDSTFTEVGIIRCMWQKCNIPATALMPSRQLSIKWLWPHMTMFTGKASIMPPETVAGVIRHDLKAKTLFCPVIGWSSYLLGMFLSQCVHHFVGIDANPRNVEVLRQVAYEQLELPKEHVHIIHGATETFPKDSLPVPKGGFEGVFFSPPYYDRERYFGSQQSHLRYKSYDAWIEGFYRPMIMLCSDVLALGGKMAVIVSDQQVNGNYYPLVLNTVEAASKVGFIFEGFRFLQLASDRKAKGVSKLPHETLLLFRKCR